MYLRASLWAESTDIFGSFWTIVMLSDDTFLIKNSSTLILFEIRELFQLERIHWTQKAGMWNLNFGWNCRHWGAI